MGHGLKKIYVHAVFAAVALIIRQVEQRGLVHGRCLQRQRGIVSDKIIAHLKQVKNILLGIITVPVAARQRLIRMEAAQHCVPVLREAGKIRIRQLQGVCTISRCIQNHRTPGQLRESASALCCLSLCRNQVIQPRQAPVAKPVLRHVKSGAVKRIPRRTAGNNSVIIPVHTQGPGHGTGSPGGLIQGLIPGFLDFPHGMPDLDHPQVPFIPEQADGGPVTVQHTYLGRGSQENAPHALPQKAQQSILPAPIAAADGHDVHGGVCFAELLLQQGKIRRKPAGLAAKKAGPVPHTHPAPKQKQDADEPADHAHDRFHSFPPSGSILRPGTARAAAPAFFAFSISAPKASRSFPCQTLSS